MKESHLLGQEGKPLAQKLSEQKQNKTEYFIPVNLIVKIMPICKISVQKTEQITQNKGN